MTPTEPPHPMIRRLAASHHSRDFDLAAVRRWNYGEVTGPVCRLTGSHGHTDFLADAITAQAFALWHAGRREVHYGKTGTSLGRALRQVGKAGAFGPADTAARRLVDNLLTAATGDHLHRAVIAAIKTLKTVDHPPHWELLNTHLRDWFDPAQRQHVRLAWGQDFATGTTH